MTARRGVLEALADEVEAWDRTIQAQRLLFWQMNHGATEADRARAMLLGIVLFSSSPVFTDQAAA